MIGFNMQGEKMMSNNLYFIDKEDGPTSYYIAGEMKADLSKDRYKTTHILLIPESERELEIYKLLEKNCDLFFCRDSEAINLSFKCREELVVFATNSRGGLYVNIGGFGNIDEDNYPVGYISSKGEATKISNNLREFIKLITFYPFWIDLLNCNGDEIEKAVENLEKELVREIPSYFKYQRKIADFFHIKKDEKAIDTLFSNIKEQPYFTVYLMATNCNTPIL